MTNVVHERVGLFADTSAGAEAVLLDLIGATSPARKLRQVEALNRSVRVLAVSGLHRRHPGANDTEVRRRLAELLLGEGLAAEVYAEVARRWGGDISLAGKRMDDEIDREAIDVTLLVTAVLDGMGIAYFVGGSLAGAVHGVLRATMDSDLVAHIQIEHVDEFVESLQDAFYVSEDAIHEAIQHRTSFNLIHLGTFFKVDIFLPKDRGFDRRQLENREVFSFGDDSAKYMYVMSAEDLVLAKLERYRAGGEVSDQQWRDILGVLALAGDRLDVDYMVEMAAELRVSDLLTIAMAHRDR